MKKIIDLPEDTIKSLQKLADLENRSLKNFIETLLIEASKQPKKKQ